MADVQYRYVYYLMEGIDDDGYMRELDQEHSYNFFNPKLGAQLEIKRPVSLPMLLFPSGTGSLPGRILKMQQAIRKQPRWQND